MKPVRGCQGSRFIQLRFLLLLLITVGCQTQQDQRDFESSAISPPSGITMTSIHGVTPDGETDPDDWRSSPFYSGVIDISPARPNPALSTEEIIIELYIDLNTRVSQIRAVVLHDNGDTPLLDEISGAPLSSGRHELRFPASTLKRTVTPEGLFRVLIYDGNWQIISYGDIRVE